MQQWMLVTLLGVVAAQQVSRCIPTFTGMTEAQEQSLGKLWRVVEDSDEYHWNVCYGQQAHDVEVCYTQLVTALMIRGSSLLKKD